MSKRLALAALAATLAVAGCEKGPEIVPAKFAASPSAADIEAAYPAFARMARIPGKVKMRCEYSMSGTLQRCRRLGVAPAGLNFEAGVPGLLSKYTVTPQTYDGRPAPAPIVFTISFNPPAAPGPYTGEPVRDADMAIVRRNLTYARQSENRMLQFQASRSVELDRMNAVGGIVDRAYAAEGSARLDTLPRAVIQVLAPSDRVRLRDPGSYVMFPTLSQLESGSPEFFAANERMAARMRTEYCAAYPCSAELPATPTP